MSRASISTLLSLDRWAAILGLDPYHFAQAYTSNHPIGSCDDMTYQWAWVDADKVSREDIAGAIALAERRIADALGYWPAPRYVVDDEIPYPRHHARELVNTTMRQVRGDRKGIALSWGKILALGVEEKTLILANAPVTRAGGTASVTAATTVTDASQIAIYFRTADGADAAASEAYRIRGGHKPLRVSISSGIATIAGPEYLFLKPSLQDGSEAIDADDPNSYVTAVDVYRRWTDPSDHGELVWEPTTACATSSDAADALTTQACCAWLRDATLGRVVPRPATWNVTTGQYDEAAMLVNYDPDRVRLNYLAGEALGSDGEMEDFWARAVAYFAVALLDRPLCACEAVSARLDRWREDLTVNTERGKSHQMHESVLACPFGTRAAAIYAWRCVQERVLGRACIA